MILYQIVIKTICKHKLLYIFLAINFVLSSALLLTTPYFSSQIVGCFSELTKEAILNSISFWFIAFIAVSVLRAPISYFGTVSMENGKAVLISELQQELFKTVHSHQISYFDDEMTGRITDAVNKVSGIVSDIVLQQIFSFIRPLILFFCTIGIIAYASPRLALVLVVLCVPYYFAYKKIVPTIINCFHQRGTLEREYVGRYVDSYTNYKLVRYTGSIFNERLNIYKVVKKYLRVTYECEAKRGVSVLSLSLIKGLFLLLAYVAILCFTAIDALSLADAFFAFQSISMLQQSISRLGNFVIEISSMYGEFKTNWELIYKPITIKDKENAEPLKITNNSITYRNIDFAYVEENPVFKNFNLNILANQKVGLVGLSGAGKSTLISLLLRSYAPQSGEILIGDQNIADVTEYSLHRNIAYVPQDVTLFNRSLFENLQLANPKATKEEIFEAAKMAHIHDTIMRLPNGYESVVGERGILLSGGERQRIAIARAILQNAPVFILDEATSALDSESEVMVQNALKNLMKNKTVIAIAHRLSTLKNMDRILVMENGEIREDGTPKDLLKKENGLLKHFYSLQTEGYLSISNNNGEKN